MDFIKHKNDSREIDFICQDCLDHKKKMKQLNDSYFDILNMFSQCILCNDTIYYKSNKIKRGPPKKYCDKCYPSHNQKRGNRQKLEKYYKKPKHERYSKQHYQNNKKLYQKRSEKYNKKGALSAFFIINNYHLISF